MDRSVIGIVAHVDAGKTTLSEAMLFLSGALRTLGRVDHQDAFLDTFALERRRGITIFAKQAVMTVGDRSFTLLDTPGHADFSAELERSLSVLDAAVVVVSGTAGVQSHTAAVWRLLRARGIPTFIFVNKTDLPGFDRAAIEADLARSFGAGVVELSRGDAEAAALCDEQLLEKYLETGALPDEAVAAAVARGRLFPCCFGSALRLTGVAEFLDLLGKYAPAAPDCGRFAARVFKISRDEQGVRLTHLKVTGGSLRVRDTVAVGGREEKVTQLRVYSGARFRTADEVFAGELAAVAGLSDTAPGMGLGAESDSGPPELQPVFTYAVRLPEGADAHRAAAQLRQLEEEDPLLRVQWVEAVQELRVQLIGQVQLEVLGELFAARFGTKIAFERGQILYRETIGDTVEGVGHYEPLRHYAEVHLLLEPAARGSGITIDSAVPEDMLDRSWQRLILSYLHEKQPVGILIGSPLTDVHITLAAGRASLKHTEGGDFREAARRAVRQGLMQARPVLLEPWFSFRLTLPAGAVGRALTDLERMGAVLEPPAVLDGSADIAGAAPVSQLDGYAVEVQSYTKGAGRLSLAFDGYRRCPDQQRVAEAIGYDPEADTENPADSIFCSHGAGVLVKWRDVPAQMHLESVLTPPADEPPARAARYAAALASDRELMQIFERTYGPIKRDRLMAMRRAPAEQKPFRMAPQPEGPVYLLVDGYNIIFAWDDLKKLAAGSLELARSRLVERLRNYQGYVQQPVIIVFDAYKVAGGTGSVERYGGLSVVYTKEAETADMYIERVTREIGKKHRVRVATSDGLEQIIVLSHGALRLPASGLLAEVQSAEREIEELLTAGGTGIRPGGVVRWKQTGLSERQEELPYGVQSQADGRGGGAALDGAHHTRDH